MTSGQNRPKRYSDGDRRILLSEDSEVTSRTVSDGNGSPVYHGRAKVGTTDAGSTWQIKKLEWDAAGYHQSTKWPETGGIATSEYDYVWDDAASVTISAITKASPGVVTTATAHGYSNGDNVVFENIAGMTQLEFSNNADKIYVVANKTSNTFEITDQDGDDVNTGSYGAFTSGTVTKPDFCNYTYS